MPTSHIPTDNERRLHVVAIAAAAVVAVAMIAAAAWSLTRPQPSRDLPKAAFTPAQETSASVIPGSASTTSSSVATATAGATTSSATVGASTEENASPVVAGHRVVYRVGSVRYVANEDGTHSRPVYGSSSTYALSPNGLRVASVEGGKLAVVAVGTRPTSASDISPGSSAQDVQPIWTADSSAVLFVRDDGTSVPSVWRYTVASKVSLKVSAGTGMAVSEDGNIVVALPTEASDSGALTVTTSSGSHTITALSGDPVAVAVSDSRVYVSTMSSSGDAALWWVSLDGKHNKKLAGASSAGGTQGSYGQLELSPDGKRLLYTVEGDDGYSRIRIVPIGGGTVASISGRRDGYPLGFSADGKRVLFIEGNAYQGQTTGLWSADIAGHNRKELVKSATM